MPDSTVKGRSGRQLDRGVLREARRPPGAGPQSTGRVSSPTARGATRIPVAGVSVSHPQRVLFPAANATKLDLARYYERIGDWIVPHVVDRPLTLVRCPTGIGPGDAKRRADCFYMKHSKVWAPDTIRRVRIREKTKTGEYLIADSVEALVGLVQMDVLEVHTWNACFSDVERPNRIVIDLDPGERVAWRTVVDAARLVRDLLAAMELDSFVKTTGGRGLHVVVPLKPAAGWDACLDFARAIAGLLVRHQPSLFTDRFARSGRSGKILVDYLRNNRTNTSIAAYSTRARPEAPVSTPLSWAELSEALEPGRFTMASVPGRLTRITRDPWKGYWSATQRISPKAVRAVEAM
jgi:bifunctional non-homologous end joining protein LigD